MIKFGVKLQPAKGNNPAALRIKATAGFRRSSLTSIPLFFEQVGMIACCLRTHPPQHLSPPHNSYSVLYSLQSPEFTNASSPQKRVWEGRMRWGFSLQGRLQIEELSDFKRGHSRLPASAFLAHTMKDINRN